MYERFLLGLGLFRFLFIFSFFLLSCSVAGRDVCAQAVPYTAEGYVGSIGSSLGVMDERRTCDEDFMDIIEARAWEEGQREITQNANIIRKPDSVLSMSCFADWMDHLAHHADDNFPQDPSNNARGSLNGAWLDFAIFTKYELVLEGSKLAWPNGGDPGLAQSINQPTGIYLYSMLELLVLDQLVGGVTEAGEVMDDISLVGCVKDYYLDDNFHTNMLGGRARSESDAPTRSALGGIPDEDVTDGSYIQSSGTCHLMGEVWMRAKCYDFATESNLDVHRVDQFDSTGAVTTAGTMDGAQEHDAFYSLETYEATAGAGNDYRKIISTNVDWGGDSHPQFGTQCPVPDNTGYNEVLVQGDGSAGYLAAYIGCAVAEHSLTLPSNWTTFFNAAVSAICGGGSPPSICGGVMPTWATAHADANPDAGDAGAVEEYVHRLSIRDAASCAPPVKLGYVVRGQSGDEYIDAVCPTPGCWFNPPATVAANGTCEH